MKKTVLFRITKRKRTLLILNNKMVLKFKKELLQKIRNLKQVIRKLKLLKSQDKNSKVKNLPL